MSFSERIVVLPQKPKPQPNYKNNFISWLLIKQSMYEGRKNTLLHAAQKFELPLIILLHSL
jgi:hypothetical protein